MNAAAERTQSGMGDGLRVRRIWQRGAALRTLTLVDSYTRECPAIEVDTGISSRQVTRVLERVIEERGMPESASMRQRAGVHQPALHGVVRRAEAFTLIHIQPGKPMQNGHVESFNGRFRDECLNANWFVNLADARRKIERWRKEYNAERPHSSLDYRTPEEFAKACSELTSRMAATPPDRPSGLVDRTAVLAGKGSLSAAP